MRLLALVLAGCGRLGFDAATPSDAADDAANGDAGHVTPPEQDPCTTCTTSIIDTATFLRDNNPWFPATTSAFELDRLEVTVARFRAFAEQPALPTAGSGAHPAIADSGWQADWDLLPSLGDPLSSISGATYTTVPGANEAMPVVGVTWYEAFAFCIWDGGRLPTVAEHEAAAFGGDEQRRYPWGDTYDPARLAHDHLEVTGRHSPLGDARWGHADLVGNADEWALDYFGELPLPCIDCANLMESPTRVLLGGSFLGVESEYAQTGLLHGMGPAQRVSSVGFRCVH